MIPNGMKLRTEFWEKLAIMIKVHEGPPRSLHCVVPLGEAKERSTRSNWDHIWWVRVGGTAKGKVSGKVVSVLEIATEESKAPQVQVTTPPHARATPETLVSPCMHESKERTCHILLQACSQNFLRFIQEMSMHFYILWGLCKQNNVSFMLVTLRRWVKSITVGSRTVH